MFKLQDVLLTPTCNVNSSLLSTALISSPKAQCIDGFITKLDESEKWILAQSSSSFSRKLNFPNDSDQGDRMTLAGSCLRVLLAANSCLALRAGASGGGRGGQS